MMHTTQSFFGENHSFYCLRNQLGNVENDKKFCQRNEKARELLNMQNRVRLINNGSPINLTHPIASKNLS